MKWLFLSSICLFLTGNAYADTVIWSGEVNSNGTPTPSIQLTLGKKYQIKASGVINLGKWWQQGKPLAEDACYEFNDYITPTKLDSLKSSINTTICNRGYNPDHIYISNPFVAAQSGIHFWIYDVDYNDNSGALQVQIIELSDEPLQAS